MKKQFTSQWPDKAIRYQAGWVHLVFYLFIFLLRTGRLDYEQLQANDLVGVWSVWAKPIHEYKERNDECGWGKKEE